MKEKNRIIADKHIKLSMQINKERDPVCSDQTVDCEAKEKVRELCMRKFPNGHVLDQTDKIKRDKPGSAYKKQGSHSLSELLFFQNYHR